MHETVAHTSIPDRASRPAVVDSVSSAGEKDGEVGSGRETSKRSSAMAATFSPKRGTLAETLFRSFNKRFLKSFSSQYLIDSYFKYSKLYFYNKDLNWLLKVLTLER